VKISKKILFFGTVILLISIVVISLQLSENLQIEDALTDDFFKSDTSLVMKKVSFPMFKEIDVSKEIQDEVKLLMKELNLKRTYESFGPDDAEYKIESRTNKEDQVYLFVDENVIVFPSKSSTGYKIMNNDEFMKTIDMLLN